MANKRTVVKTKAADGSKSKVVTRKMKDGSTKVKSKTKSGGVVTKSRSVVGKKNKENYIGGKPQTTNFSRTVVRKDVGPKGKFKSKTVTKKGSRNDGTGNEAVSTKKVTRRKLPSTYKNTEKSQSVKGNGAARIKGTRISGSSSSSKTRKSIKQALGMGQFKKKK